MSGDVVERLRAGLVLVGESETDEGTIELFDTDGAETVMAEAAELVTSQAAEIEQLKKERDGLFNSGIGTVAKLCAAEYSVSVLTNRAETAERLLAEARAALEWSARLFDGIRGAVETNQVVDKDVHGTAISGRDAARAAARTLTNGGENGR